MAVPTSNELVRQFVQDENGFLKATFNDPNTGAVVPAENLQQYYEGTYTPEAYSDGLPQPTPTTTSLGGISQDQIRQVSSPISDTQDFLVKGSGTQHTTEGDTSPRSQSNNFGYVNDPAGMGLATTALGMVNPALGLAAKGVGGLINNNNALAVSSARRSIGLDPLSGISIAQKTFSGTAKGKVGDVSIGDQKYTVGLEAADAEGRTTLTPEEARRRSATLGQPIKEVDQESGLGKGVLDAATKVAGGMLPGPVKAGVGILGAATKKAPEGFNQQGVAANLMNAGRQKLGLTPKLDPKDPKSVTTSPLTLGAPQQAPVSSRPLSALGEETSSASPLGPKKSVPSFDSLSSTPKTGGMIKNASLISETQPRDNTSGLAGITTSGKFGRLDSMDRSNLDPSINKALDAIGSVAPGLGINSGYRDPATNAAAGGAKRSQHMQGKAVDINISGLSDDQKRDALESAVQNGVKGVGIYSGGRTLHIDTREGGLKTWGANPKNTYAGVDISQQPSWAQDTLKATEGAGIYSPGPRVGPVPTDRQAALNAPTREQKTAKTLADLEGKDLSSYSAGRLASMGFAPSMSAQEVGAVSRMIAGEVSPNTLKGLARSDPKAIAEVGNIASTAINRASQVGWDKTLQAYDSVNGRVPSALKTTNANYSKFGKSIQEAVRSSLTGETPAPNPDATHYANMSVSNPSWGKAMTNVSVQNEHTFGNVGREYGGVAKTTAAKAQATRAQQAVADAAASNLNSKAGQNLSFNDQRADKAASAAASAAQARAESTKSSGLGAKKSESSKASTASASSTSSTGSKSTSSTSGSSKGSGTGNSGSGVGSKSTSSSASGSKSTSSSSTKSASNSSSSNSKSSGSSSSKSGGSKSGSKSKA